MNSKVSELMDGELEAREAEQLITALRDAQGQAREAWRTYHLISDAMRDTARLSPGFAARVAERLAAEPTLLAPRVAPQGKAPVRAWGLRLAAGVGAVALVAGVVLVPQQGGDTPPLAQAPKPAAVAKAEPVRVPPPAAAHDYLLAHQRYSPGVSLQGMAPYVRSVSADMGKHRP